MPHSGALSRQTDSSARPPSVIADEKQAMLSALKRLTRDEFDVETALIGADTLLWLEQRTFRVAPTDQGMPGLSGVDFLTTVNDRHADAIRLLSTGQADLENVIQAIHRGNICRYFARPWFDEHCLYRMRLIGSDFRHEHGMVDQ